MGEIKDGRAINSMTLEELEDQLKAMGSPRFRALQIYQWFHKKKAAGYGALGNIPKELRNSLEERHPFLGLELVESHPSGDGETVKHLFRCKDGQVLETVWMRYKHGNSLCISSQAGCRMGCAFCASTIGGLARNLDAAEMLEQVYQVERMTKEPVSSVVVMGTGEPFDNFQELIRFLVLLNHPEGRNLGQRHVTVSTCGLSDKIREFADLQMQVNLAVSLHAPSDELRTRLMPVNMRYPLKNLLDACRYYVKKTNRRITFEYSLLDGVNDTEAHARALVRILKGIHCHINLIPVNAVEERAYRKSKPEAAARFKKVLDQSGMTATVRRSLGEDIDAACGQLRRKHKP
ncbi:23S rRNA (adenine(2503)-C(2))-methyltransferase RlmN [Anaerotalea alkaliphila]|uniref:Probable dual-specificity RNA methyltransferase RlmN n=1 Tax=Anaerotalea alkaliphila TaxID=2662126 RepID=A0A7X5KMM9_9FIRM|nr:23S rRNA (adenine(2503)-C(2))-methyltransferase RlmN [Anaerotalea alkaliphila]NDL66888.1 23S rRNA (adenine(2503)-C(2))-methyltransferase RlmN [Anaerotalea alkaliphila]